MLRARAPRKLPREYRRYFKHIQQEFDALQQARPGVTVGGGGGSSSNNEKLGAGPSAQGGVNKIVVQGGTLPPVPAGRNGDILAVQFTDAGIFKPTQEIRLAGDHIHAANSTLLLHWDGLHWVELARSGGGNVVVNAADFGLSVYRSDNNIPILAAIAALPSSGGTVFIPKAENGPYHAAAIMTINKPNVTLLFEDGCHIYSDHNSAIFNFNSTQSVTATATVTATANRFDLTLTVAAGDEAKFSAGDWVVIEDDEAPFDGTSVKKEVNRIKSTASGELTLYFPTVNDYNTATRTVTAFSSTANFGRMRGRVILENAATQAIRIDRCYDVKVEGAEIIDATTSGITVLSSRNVLIDRCQIGYAASFSGSAGYGITTTSCTEVICSNNHIHRTRHAIDFSHRSTGCLMIGNSIYATGEASLALHPTTRYCAIIGNTIDGACGYTAAGTNLTNVSGGGATLASGISVREQSQHFLIAFNTVANVSVGGIKTAYGCRDGMIIGNTINYWGQSGDSFGAISCLGGTAGGVIGSNMLIADNHIAEGKGFGVICEVNDSVIEGNYIGDISTLNYGIGILVRGNTDNSADVANVTIKDNVIHGISEHGIYIGEAGQTTTDTLILNNVIYDCGSSGIHILSTTVTDITIKDNYISNVNNVSNSQTMGAIYHGSTSSGARGSAVIEGNVIEGVCRNGIVVNIDDAVVRNNSLINVTGTTGVGIALYVLVNGGAGSCSRIFFDNNYVLNADTYGALVGSSSGNAQTGTVFIRNIFTGCDTYDIYNRNTASGTVFCDNYGDGSIQDDGASSVYISHFDANNKRYGLGTLTPSARTHVVGSATNPLRVGDGTRNADFFYYNSGSGIQDGLTVVPDNMASGSYKAFNFFANPGSGTPLSFFDDGSTFGMPRNSGKSIYLDVATSLSGSLMVNFAAKFQWEGSRNISWVPLEFITAHGAAATVAYPLVVKAYYSGGNPSAGFGAGVDWQLETTGDAYTSAARWDVRWSSVANDSYIDFSAMDATTLKPIMRIDGSVPGVYVGNGSLATPSTLFHINGGLTSSTHLPTADEQDDLGASGNKWNWLYVSNITSSGAIRYNYRVSSASPTTHTNSDYYLTIDTSGGAITVNLLATDDSQIGAGYSVSIKRNGGSNVTISPNGSNTIDGASSHTLSTDGDAVRLVSNGGTGAAGDWKIFASNP